MESIETNSTAETSEDKSVSEVGLKDLPKIITQEDLTVFKDSLKDKNYIELDLIKYKIQKEMCNLKKTKESILKIDEIVNSTITKVNSLDDASDALDDMTKKKPSDNQLNTEIMFEDALKQNDYFKNKKEFDENYDIFMKDMIDATAIVDEELKRYDNVKKSASFMTSEYLSILKRKSETSKDEEHKKAYDFLINIYNNRTNLDFLTKKAQLSYTLHDMNKNLKKDRKKYMSRAVELLVKTFTSVQLKTVEKYLVPIFNNDNAFQLFIYHLAKIVKYDRKNAEWIKVLFMNINDIQILMYDIGDPKEYKLKLSEIASYYIKEVNTK
jgi:hypothetical protein